jgi:hypothetical protein
MVEPIIRVKDIAWIRLRSPDLDVAEEYLRDFGLLRAERTAGALYMRGTDPVHHIHITEKGDPKVERIAFWAKSEDDLHTLSRDAAGASPVETLDEPGAASAFGSPSITAWVSRWSGASRPCRRFRCRPIP